MNYGGGGFLAGSQGGSQTSPGGGKRGGPSGLRPVTIHQILTATQNHPDGEFYVDGSEVKDVTFVAIVRNSNKTSTNLGYMVEDGTGAVDIRQWMDSSIDPDSEEDAIEMNTYVRVIGSLKTFSGKRHIHCNVIRPVVDKNEILFHSIEVVYVTLYAKKGAPGPAKMEGITTGHGQQQSTNNPYATGGADGGSNDANFADLPILQRKIMMHIAEAQNSDDFHADGININAIARAVPAPGGLDKIRKEIDSLTAEGHLYFTIDDDHVLPTG